MRCRNRSVDAEIRSFEPGFCDWARAARISRPHQFFTFRQFIQWLEIWRRQPQDVRQHNAGRHVGNTNRRMLRGGSDQGDVAVHLRSIRGGVVAALAMAALLGGCANSEVDVSQPWFRKPLQLFGQTGGYQYSDLEETRHDRPVTAQDLVEQNGTCAPQAPVAGTGPGAIPAAAAADSALGGAVALGMTECEVVYRAGEPSNIQLGRNPNGDRTAVMTYQSGPRPGIYRFERGRLMEMDSVPTPTTVSKRPAPAKKPHKRNNQA